MHIGLAVFAVMMSLVGAFYYLRVVKVMYFDAPVQTEVLQAGGDVRVVLTINGALVLVLGLFPGGLMALCARAVSSMMAG
jgi:NADH-quinone oxidoreductase subunit N